jgi:hypothetical protein
MFKAVNKAKKVMLEPPKPKAATPAPSPQATLQGTGQRQTQQRTTQSQANRQRTSQSSTAHQRNKYNTATTFMSNVPHVADREESALYDMYEVEARNRYKQGSDMFRITWSLLATLLVFALSAYQLVMAFMTDPATTATGTAPNFIPYLIMLGICLVKGVVYDMMVSHALGSLLGRNNWMSKISLAGVELSVLSAVFMFLTAPITNVIAIGLLFFGFAMIGGGYIASMVKRSRMEAAIEDQAL